MSSTASVTSNEAPSPKRTGGLKGWAKTVQVYHESHIAIDCGNPDHFGKKKANVYNINGYRNGDQVPVPKPAKEILSMMLAFKPAKCKCERSACEEAWNWNAPGVFQGDFVCRPNYFKGTGEIKPSAPQKRVMPVGFRLSPTDYATLHERFPDWLFIQTGSGGHDHPISHVTSQIVTFEVMNKLRRNGRYLDVHGNPTANEAYMRSHPNAPKIDTFVSLCSPKDAVRAKTKWGPQKRGDHVRWHTGPYIRDFDVHNAELAANKDGFLSFHTGYYYEMSEIRSFLRGSPDATFTMVMHRFRGTSGSFNNGELSWVKEGGYITQTNVKTGEKYVHPDNEKWFKQSSWTDADIASSCKSVESEDGEKIVPNPEYDSVRGLAWTTNMACADVYIVTVVGCAAWVVHNDEAWKQEDPVSNKPSDVAARGGLELETMGKPLFVPIRTEHLALFDECRSAIRNKERTEQRWKAHCATVAAKCKAVFATHKVHVDSDALGTIQTASFWVDFKQDAISNANMLTQSSWLVSQHAKVLAGKALNRADNVITLTLEVVAHALRAKPGRETVSAIVTSLQAITTKVT